jgi:ankyrin repeat protein
LGWLGTVRDILNGGDSPDSPDKHGYAPLMLAVMWGHEDIARVLLELGADPHVRNRLGQTAREMISDHTQWAKTLLEGHVQKE